MEVVFEEGMKVLYPAEGKFLTDGETYADGNVYMNPNTPHDEWYEVDEIPDRDDSQYEPISDTDALNIVLGNE